jgi:cytochrome c oxidase subunit 2
MLVLKRLITFIATSVTLATAGMALAASGQPEPWQLGMQKGATPVMDDIIWFHDFLLWVISAIAIFVLALLLTVVVKFNARTNPVPSRTTHNTTIEVLWTVVPVLILVTIAVPSFRLLFFQLNVPKADVTVKATGKQWFWSYSYPDSKFEFDSLLACDQERTKCEQPRLLAVDNEMVVPVNKVVHVLTTGSDVIHAFAVPAFGISILLTWCGCFYSPAYMFGGQAPGTPSDRNWMVAERAASSRRPFILKSETHDRTNATRPTADRPRSSWSLSTLRRRSSVSGISIVAADVRTLRARL